MSEAKYFTPNQFKTAGGSTKNKLKSVFRGTQAAWNKFLRPAVNTLAPGFGVAAAAKSKYPQVGQATANILKSISGRKLLNLTDTDGDVLRLKVL